MNFLKNGQFKKIYLKKNFFNVIGYIVTLGFPNGSVGKESTCYAGNTGDMDSIPGSGRSSEEDNYNPLQYSCLENPMEKGTWWIIVQGLQRVGHN